MIFSDFVSILGLIIIPVGLFLGLLGFRLFRPALIVVGMFVGYLSGQWVNQIVVDIPMLSNLVSRVAPLRVFFGNTELVLFMGMIFGIPLGILAFHFIKFSLFLLGLAGGYLAATLVLPNTSVPPSTFPYYLWTAGISLVCGLATRLIFTPFIILFTSFIGTYFVYRGVSGADFYPFNPPDWILYPFVALFAIFMIVQFLQSRGRNKPGFMRYHKHKY